MRLLRIWLLLASAPLWAAEPGTLVETLAEEASLRGVFFIDAQRGWAVGDHGAILRTTDGGQRWRRAPSPTEQRLDGVWFVDPTHGWAVGGGLEPYTGQSRGVVLVTENGGREWEVVARRDVPRLRAVRFFDRLQGVAAGDGSALFPAGVFTTDDGGKHWRPAPGSAERRWLAGAFTRDRFGDLAGVVAGLRGSSARIAGRHVDLSSGAGDRRGGWGVALSDAANGWLVGDGGLVRTTDDGGQSWGPPAADPPQTLTDWFDWRAVAVRDQRVWIAGAPGSVVLHSDDGGASWGASKTGVTTPLTAVTFVDDANGWAVGEFGVVLATRDGGRSWRTQRGAERRAAALVVVAQPTQLPTELLAQTAAAEGYRMVAAAPLLPQAARAAGATSDRIADAAMMVGADGTRLGWATPLDRADAGLPAAVLRDRLDRLTDHQSHELLVRELQKALIAYRPDLVVTPRPDGGVADLLAAAVEQALPRAALEPPSEVGAPAWRARRLVALAADDGSPLESGETRFATGEFSAMLGATPAQWRRGARGVLTREYRAAPAAYRGATIAGAPAPNTTRADLLAGFCCPAAATPAAPRRGPT